MAARDIADTHDRRKTAASLLRGGVWRIALFLTLNLIGYAVVNAFWEYLGTTRWWDFSKAGYYRGLVSPLGEMFLHPLSVLSHPWMILVSGLLLGAVIFVPLVTAVLHRRAPAIVFGVLCALLVANLAHAAVLGLFLMCGCVVAVLNPLRRDMPFFAFIIGLLPVGAYMYLFAFAGGRSAEVLPLQRWVLTGPLLIAIVVAVIAGGSVLVLARVTRYRPGVILPILAILGGGAMAIFYTRVGVDELRYALTTDGLSAGDVIFPPVKLETWRKRHGAEGLTAQTLEIRLRDDLQGLQKDLADKSDEFLARHAESDRVAAVLWIKAQSKSLQLDAPAFKGHTVRYSASFPLPASAIVWKRIIEQCPGTPHAALGEWRLGELALRRRDIAEADERLHTAAESLATFLAQQESASKLETETMVFLPTESFPPRVYYAEALFRLRRLIWLMDRNDVANDDAAAEALGALLNENPYELEYEARVGKLVGLYERTRLGDNLKLAAAMATGDPYVQAEMLIWLAEDERTDAAVEANYQLGMLAMQTARARALPLIPKLKKPQSYFRTVIAAPPNPWQDLARKHLTSFGKEPTGAP